MNGTGRGDGAPLLKAPALVGIGLDDDVVFSCTVQTMDHIAETVAAQIVTEPTVWALRVRAPRPRLSMSRTPRLACLISVELHRLKNRGLFRRRRRQASRCVS